MSDEPGRFVVRREHKLTGSGFCVGVRETEEAAVELAKAERDAGKGLIKTSVTQYPSPKPLREFE